MEMDYVIEEAQQILAEVIAERKRVGNLAVIATAAIFVAALAGLASSMIQQQLAADAAAFRQAIDDQGRKAAKARHPAGRSRAQRSSSSSAAPGPPGRAAERALAGEDLTTPEHPVHPEPR